jgi:hypothetical protein
MEYLTGYTLKPYEVTTLGEVLFTDGANNSLMVNQITCEAYGYTYDRVTGTCRSFRYNSSLERTIGNMDNKNNGAGNTNALGSNTIQVNGIQNITRGRNNNCFINGSNNEIANGVDNSTVLGVGGKSNRQGELVLGGGQNEVISPGETIVTTYSDRKASTVNLSAVTRDNSPTTLTVNGISDFEYININNNSIVGFEIYITRLEVGGTSGVAGNYSYRNIKGVVRIDNAGAMLFIVGYTRNIGKYDSGGGSGVNGTAVMVDSTTGGVPSISIQVTDRNNVTNIWSATVTLHELISTKTTF